MKRSVIICTYQAPRELDFALCALARQSLMPDEVMVADDGSDEGTQAVVEEWRSRVPFRLDHCWHVDRGYRKARIVNEAVRRSTGEHLLFLDGDSFPHPHWVADHAAAYRPRRALCGRRVKLGPDLSCRVTRDDVASGKFDGVTGTLVKSALRGDTKRLGLGIRVPQVIARMFHPRPRRLMGVNFSLGREVFYSVNGLNERWTFYGREDYDLELRLRRSRIELYPLLNRGIVYHMHHIERTRSTEALELVAQMEQSNEARCELGVEDTALFDPAS